MSLPMTTVMRMRTAAIPLLFDAVNPIPHIGVISPNCFRHSNGTLKTNQQRLPVREHIQADAMAEITA